MKRFIKLTQAYGAPGQPLWINPEHIAYYKAAPAIPSIDYPHSMIMIDAVEDAENGAVVMHVKELPDEITKLLGHD